MIAIFRKDAKPDEINAVRDAFQAAGASAALTEGEEHWILTACGDASGLDGGRIGEMAGVERVVIVTAPYRLAGRRQHPENTRVDVGGGAVFGASDFPVIAGPCSVESREQIEEIARAVKLAGASALRGGAFKPRTSPYAYQGIGAAGLPLLKRAGEAAGLPVVSELVDCADLPLFEECVDLIQVGARNMQNYAMLKRLGKSKKPVLLKRGMMATVEEWLLAAEYILLGGNERVILCERGIRTFENGTRATLDLSAVALAKRLSHLPVIADPSHACGRADLVEPLALAAAAAGADGLMLEVHGAPEQAFSDGAQAITPAAFTALMEKLRPLLGTLRRTT